MTEKDTPTRKTGDDRHKNPNQRPSGRRYLPASKWQRVLLFIAAGLIGLFGLSYVADRSFPEVQNPNYGVSFSVKYARELGVDWQKNFLALMDDMKLRNFRLMSYWDEIEPERGKYNFRDLDWQMEQAAKRGAKVSLSIGLRQPRWPECHKPSWYEGLSRPEQRKALLAYLETVVKRYRSHPALLSYQLENEALNRWFGECTPEDIDRPLLKTEFALVKRLDRKHPVWMSLSDQHGLPLGEPVPDKYGFSVYRIVHPQGFYFTYPTPLWYHRLRAWWIETFKDREVFIHELQLEPWGPEATVNLSREEQSRSMNPGQIKTNLSFARKIGKQDIYAWGGEWWYWRKTTHNDPTIWDTVKREIHL